MGTWCFWMGTRLMRLERVPELADGGYWTVVPVEVSASSRGTIVYFGNEDNNYYIAFSRWPLSVPQNSGTEEEVLTSLVNYGVLPSGQRPKCWTAK